MVAAAEFREEYMELNYFRGRTVRTCFSGCGECGRRGLRDRLGFGVSSVVDEHRPWECGP